MTFHVLTIFPDFIGQYLKIGVLSKALVRGKVSVKTYDIRDNAVNRYGQVDHPVFGTGKGMLFRCEPVDRSLSEIRKNIPGGRIVFLTPRGKRFDYSTARELSKYP